MNAFQKMDSIQRLFASFFHTRLLRVFLGAREVYHVIGSNRISTRPNDRNGMAWNKCAISFIFISRSSPLGIDFVRLIIRGGAKTRMIVCGPGEPISCQSQFRDFGLFSTVCLTRIYMACVRPHPTRFIISMKETRWQLFLLGSLKLIEFQILHTGIFLRTHCLPTRRVHTMWVIVVTMCSYSFPGFKRLRMRGVRKRTRLIVRYSTESLDPQHTTQLRCRLWDKTKRSRFLCYTFPAERCQKCFVIGETDIYFYIFSIYFLSLNGSAGALSERHTTAAAYCRRTRVSSFYCIYTNSFSISS